jgi:hypothetical protein
MQGLVASRPPCIVLSRPPGRLRRRETLSTPDRRPASIAYHFDRKPLNMARPEVQSGSREPSVYQW